MYRFGSCHASIVIRTGYTRRENPEQRQTPNTQHPNANANADGEYHHCPRSIQRVRTPLQPLHFSQTDRRRDPREADQGAHLLPHPDRIARHVQAGDGPLQRFGPAVLLVPVPVAAPDAQDRVFHVAIVLLFHRLGGFALALALGAVLAQYVAGEDFDFGDEVRGVGGVLEHRVDEIFFVARVVSSARLPATKEDNLLVFHVLGPSQVMLPLDQGRLLTDIIPDSICQTSSVACVEPGHPGLFLDCLEEFVLVDVAVKLPKDILALIVHYPWRTIARYFIELVVLILGCRRVHLLEVDGLFNEDSRAGSLEIWASFWKVGQLGKINLCMSVRYLEYVPEILMQEDQLVFRSSKSLPQ